MNYTPGIDVSHWQGAIDWPAVRKAGKRFAFIKATESTSFVDPDFKTNWRGAKDAGLLRGAYHFFRPLANPRAQARHFLENLDMEAGDLPPVLDLEDSGTVRNATLIQRVEIWIDEVQDQTGVFPIIYSGVSFLNTHFTTASGKPPLWTKDFILWIANYLGANATEPFMPSGWREWLFWQHSASGRVDGIQGNVDLDWFNGPLEALFALAKHPGGGESHTETSTRYTVQQDDTLRSIARQFGIKLRTLVAANPGLIQPGMQLIIPVRAESSAGEQGRDN